MKTHTAEATSNASWLAPSITEVSKTFTTKIRVMIRNIIGTNDNISFELRAMSFGLFLSCIFIFNLNCKDNVRKEEKFYHEECLTFH